VRISEKGVYKGGWKDKQFNGKGSINYNDGSSYEGYFLNDLVLPY
jgi:hypothetical protein